MLLPTLQAARDKAKNIGCLNNLKQMHYAVILYSNDNKEWIYPALNAAKLKTGGNSFSNAAFNSSSESVVRKQYSA